MMADWLEKINNKNSVFAAKGGTEILLENLKKYSTIDERSDINLILCTPDYSKIKYTKKNILWQHLNYIDESLGLMKDQAFMKSISATVYVSHWQLEKFRYLFQVPLNNAYVVRNAIEPIEFKTKDRDGKLKLIYTSTPFRGLSVLLDVFEMLDRDDIELEIYSSTKIYSSGYEEKYDDLYKDLFDRAREMKNVNYHGYAENKEIHKAVQEAHIFAYPSIFEETACLAMIEAGAAGCSLVTTDLGALPETGGCWSNMVTVKADIDDIVTSYAKLLNESIDNYWSISNQEHLKNQSEYFNNFYSWERRAKEWEKLFNEISS